MMQVLRDPPNYKPRLKIVPGVVQPSFTYKWICIGKHGRHWGHTPKEAYDGWKRWNFQ